MLVANRYLGHREEDAVADRLAETEPAVVVLSDTERQRSRVRTRTTDGTELGVVVPEDLGDGDVLETDDGDLVVVELAAVDALVLELDGADISPTAALELGHALGNRHWELALRDGEALFPVPDSRERMDAIVDADVPEGIDHRYEAVSPTLFDDADGGDGHEHSHTGGIRTVEGGIDR